MMPWFFSLGQAVILVLLAPLASGLVSKLKARLQNRVGSPLLRPYQDLIKLLWFKETLLAENASWLFRFAPYLIFAATVMAVSGLPVAFVRTPSILVNDAIVLVGLLALARFFTALAAMDIGTAFGGMGASREMILSALAEPAILMSILVLSMQIHGTNLAAIVSHTLNAPVGLSPSIAFALASMLMVALAECGRLPVDNPGTHLELTMIHEAMILEYTGRHLGLIEWANQVKLVLFATLIVALFIPWGMTEATTLGSFAIALAIWGLKMIGVLLLLAILETSLAKLRIFHVPEYLSAAFLLALLGMLTHFILETTPR